MINDDDITCDWFEARLSAFLEDDLDAETRIEMEKHALGCDACNALVMDLRALSVDARVLPDLVAPRDLWQGIAARIEAPVIGIDSGVARSGARTGAPVLHSAPRRSWSSRGWLGAAAAGLVAVTAGVTYLVTSRIYDRPLTNQVATTVRLGDTSRDRGTAIGQPAPAAGAAGSPTTAEASRPGTPVQAASLAASSDERTYDLEITRLRRIVATRRSRLDPYTVSVIERSLSVIDQAIAESRAALAKDPASGFLSEQLNNALDKKVQLLRTAAMLPART